MKPTELRIGNYVKQYDKIVKLVGIIDDGVYFDEDINGMQGELWGYKDFNPIPLTEDWLKRFRFEKVKYIDCYNWTFLFTEFDTFGVWQNKDKNKFYYNVHYRQINLKYVHQLQNLYFALTGKELTYEN